MTQMRPIWVRLEVYCWDWYDWDALTRVWDTSARKKSKCKNKLFRGVSVISVQVRAEVSQSYQCQRWVHIQYMIYYNFNWQNWAELCDKYLMLSDWFVLKSVIQLVFEWSHLGCKKLFAFNFRILFHLIWVPIWNFQTIERSSVPCVQERQNYRLETK